MVSLKAAALALGLASLTWGQSQAGVDGQTGGAPAPDLYTKDLGKCPGYVATKSRKTQSGFYADLKLAGEACNVFGQDLPDLTLEVEYQTPERLHVKIADSNRTVYQVPDDVFPRPGFGQWCSPHDSKLQFDYRAEPFSFTVSRTDTKEVLFDTSGSKLVFETQYVHLETKLPHDPFLYGLGEHSDSFRLNTTNYTRTIWTRDAYGVPQGENLYGAHPIYFEHRTGGTHGVFLLNSNGMDVYIDDTDGQTLEYNIIGGVLDFYFIAGPKPKDVAMQYAEIVETPLMTPYWGLGFHQCKYGYRDVYWVAEVVANYSAAGIPLETMWTDIDYMELRRVFTLDPERFPAHLVTDLVDTIHARDQHYVVMVDPAVYFAQANPALDAGIRDDVFLKENNGSFYEGVVWPGPTYFPDWFHPNSTKYWNEQFLNFFDGVHGPDIDALWIDMNEPANFCNRPWPCKNSYGFAEENDNPPAPPPVRSGPNTRIPGFPESLQGDLANKDVETRDVAVAKRHPRGGPLARKHKGGRWQLGKPWGAGRPGKRHGGWQHAGLSGSGCSEGECLGFANRELIQPPYMIQNGAGPTLAEGTADTDIYHANGLAEYDTHNLYGSMMSSHSTQAMLARRPESRPLVITRSTFAGAGKEVSHWLGDNISGWRWYQESVSQILQFASLYQVPVVGADVCGFGGNTTVTLCSRWATLGAFYTFFRNHAEISAIDQEFYRWPEVAAAARNAISIRYQLLDYIYTAIYHQNQTGLPALNPVFFNYPEDPATFAIDSQFFYGDGILVSPVWEENSTSVSFYLPDDQFYEWGTGKPVRGHGAHVDAEVPLDQITLHYKSGIVYPQRLESANTTAALRTKGFNLVVAPGLDGKAAGRLYLDDGDSLVQDSVSEIEFEYCDGQLSMSGSFGYDPAVNIEMITLLGVHAQPHSESSEYDAKNQKAVFHVNVPLTKEATLALK